MTRRLARLIATTAATCLAGLGPFLASGAQAAAPSAQPSAAAVSGGELVYSDAGTACVGDFNAQGGGSYYLLMPGRCTQGTSYWYADAAHTVPIGPTSGSGFPGADAGLVRYEDTDPAPPGTVGDIDITSAGNAYVGEPVSVPSPAGGTHSGVVTNVNATVNMGGTIFYGLIETTVCVEPGDRMGPLISGSTALGIPLAASGDCTSGGGSFFQPVTETLQTYGLSIY